MLVNKQEYRNQQLSISEAIRIRETYEKETDFDQLVILGMGKQALAGTMKWINDELALKLSHTDLLSFIDSDNVPEEITHILNQLRSKEARENPMPMPVVETQEEAQTDEEEIEVLIPRQLELDMPSKPKVRRAKKKE